MPVTNEMVRVGPCMSCKDTMINTELSFQCRKEMSTSTEFLKVSYHNYNRTMYDIKGRIAQCTVYTKSSLLILKGQWSYTVQPSQKHFTFFKKKIALKIMLKGPIILFLSSIMQYWWINSHNSGDTAAIFFSSFFKI